jgi:outer membrane lipoprotein-sorting protein
LRFPCTATFTTALILLWALPLPAAGPDTNLLSAWLGAQTNIQTWRAEVTQTRSFKTLARPLTAHGRVWFAAPNQFRWELGDPARTIAVRQPEQMLIVYPLLKRAERYPLDPEHAGPLRDTLALLDAGFPRDAAQLETRFRVLEVTQNGGRCRVVLEPKAAAARRLMPHIAIEFDPQKLDLTATELEFADGSTMRNEFTNPALNSPFPADLFQPEIGADFKVVEPLKQQNGK